MQFGYRADYSHGGHIGVIYGMRLGRISAGRGALPVQLSCPASKSCPRATVRATAKERSGSQIVVVGAASGAISAGNTRTLAVTLNRGHRLLARSPGRLAVRVVVKVGSATLATRGIRVLRL